MQQEEEERYERKKQQRALAKERKKLERLINQQQMQGEVVYISSSEMLAMILIILCYLSRLVQLFLHFQTCQSHHHTITKLQIIESCLLVYLGLRPMSSATFMFRPTRRCHQMKADASRRSRMPNSRVSFRTESRR